MVPASPRTLAPSGSRQLPAIGLLALKRYTPSAEPGIEAIFVVMSAMASGAMSRRVAKITASGTGLPVLESTSRTAIPTSGPTFTALSTSSKR